MQCYVTGLAEVSGIIYREWVQTPTSDFTADLDFQGRLSVSGCDSCSSGLVLIAVNRSSLFLLSLRCDQVCFFTPLVTSYSFDGFS